LKGFDKSLRDIDAAIFIVLDNDSRDKTCFQQMLSELATAALIEIDHVFCVAVEEVEAWLLGDQNAIETAYPQIRDRIRKRLSEYTQDSICGTWEVLADMLYDGGINKFKRDNPSYIDIGRHKCNWSDTIGRAMDIRNNQSPSFCYFVSQLDMRIIVS
jgi:hypothetical protein